MIKREVIFTVEVDVEKLISIHGEKAVPFFEESLDEFIDELNTFLDNHPLVKGCRLKE